jgi:hypothetical protein
LLEAPASDACDQTLFSVDEPSCLLPHRGCFTLPLKSVVTKRGGDTGKVAFVDLGTLNLAVDGSGCGWHRNVKQHQDVAKILIPVVKQKLGW